MPDATPSSPSNGRSVLYALGRLEGTVSAQADALKDLPGQIISLISPQLAIITDHESRLRSLEKQRWLLLGGGTFAVTIVGWLVSLK